MPTAYIGLGSNLGSREENLRTALRRLGELPGTQVLATSEFINTKAVGGPPGQPDFLNAAAALRTSLPPTDLLDAMLAIEQELGRDRRREVFQGPRTLDLDLLLYDQQIVRTPELTIPHPRMHARFFVLAPLAQIAPDVIHPTERRSIRELLAALPQTPEAPRTMRPPQVFPTVEAFRQYRQALPAGTRVMLVPTMGALHEGHASLVREARRRAGASSIVAVSIFVNPTQFGPQEDFAQYPRTFDADVDLLGQNGADAVFAPTPQVMYPKGAGQITVDPGPLANILEGAIRPGHFRGVCTVVCKLLSIVQPHEIIMGQKDFQQNVILRQMIRDLNLPVEHVSCPTIREADGLAMSSRNRYLNPDERARAVGLYEALLWAQGEFAAGRRDAPALQIGMRERLEARGLLVQYAFVCHPETLAEYRGPVAGPAAVLLAAKLGTTRLIDNWVLT